MSLVKTDNNKIIVTLNDAEKLQALISELRPNEVAAWVHAFRYLSQSDKDGKIARCTPESQTSAFISCLALGLNPSPSVGHIHFVPYGNVLTPIVGYQGMVKIMLESGAAKSISPEAVYDGDEFYVEKGTNRRLVHRPMIPVDDGGEDKKRAFIAAYVTFVNRHDVTDFIVMYKHDIDAVMRSSKTATSSYSPWKTHYESMAKKTVIRRLRTVVPMDPKMAEELTKVEQMDYTDTPLSKTNIAGATGSVSLRAPKQKLDVAEFAQAEEVDHHNRTKSAIIDSVGYYAQSVGQPVPDMSGLSLQKILDMEQHYYGLYKNKQQ